MWLKFVLLFTALVCVGCGNPDLGAQAKLKAKASANSSSAISNNSAAAQAALAQTVCKAASVYEAGDTLFGQVMTGLNICYSAGAPSLTQVKVSSYVAGYRYCLVPVRGEIAGTESCFTAGSMVTSVSLQSSSYDALILVSENNVGYYKSYLSGQTNVMPPLAVAALPH